MACRGNAGYLTITGERQGVLVVADRGTNPDAPMFDAPHWFSVKWRGGKIHLAEIGRWEDMNYFGLRMRGVLVDDGSLWAGTYYPGSSTKPAGYHDTQLLLAQSNGLELPVPRFTDVECVDFSDLIPFGEEVYVLVTARFASVELWAIDRRLNMRRVHVLEKAKKKNENVGPARMARCGDSLIMVWGYYTPRVGEKKPRTWQGVLHGASYDPQTESVSEVVALTADVRVVAATLDVHRLRDSILVTWESRPKRGGGGMRAVRLSTVDQSPLDPVVLPEKHSPLFVMGQSGPILRAGQTLDTSSWAIPADMPSM